MAETLNMVELPLSDIIRFIDMTFSSGLVNPVVIIGKMGMGKTASIEGLCKHKGWGYKTIRLVNHTETDLIGLPTINKYGEKDVQFAGKTVKVDEAFTTFANNELLPYEARDGAKGILVLDEITSCSSTMRAAAFQLLDSQRALGNYKLPDGWMCIALGNGPDDGGVYVGGETALWSRCRCFRVAQSFESFKQYAINTKFNPTVLGYLSWSPDSLHVMDEDAEYGGQCPCPRTWEMLSDWLNVCDENTLKNDKALVRMAVASSIGQKEAGKFMGYWAISNAQSITVEDVLSGKAKPTDIQNSGADWIQGAYSLIANLTSVVNRDIQNEHSKNPNEMGVAAAYLPKLACACNFILGLEDLRLDLAITGIQTLTQGPARDLISQTIMAGEIGGDNTFDKLCPKFLEFAQKNNLIL